DPRCVWCHMSHSTAPLRVATVGAGFWARFQVRAWRELERQGLVQIAALCGANVDGLDQLRVGLGSPGVPIYTDLEQLLQSVPGLGVVDLITPTPSHHELTLQVLA